MAKLKYLLIILCTFSVCAKIVGHTYRHLYPTTVAVNVQ